MTDLEKYEVVNKCETFEDFKRILLSFADENGEIQGRSRKFNANRMIELATEYYETDYTLNPNIVTREYGLRQQLMYLKYYK